VDRPFRLGSILFTMVDVEPSTAVAYNRFYERDHFYAGMLAGPYCFSGQRWVATHDLKMLRYPQGPSLITPDHQVGSLLSLYWMEEGGHDAWNQWSVDAWHELNAAGRIRSDRDRTHSALYRSEFAVLRDADGPAPEQALDHRYPGLAAVVVDGADRQALLAWLRDRFLPARLERSPVSQVLGFTMVPLHDDAPADMAGMEMFASLVLMLWFLDDAATAVWSSCFAHLPREVEQGGVGRVEWMSPFLPTIPGTDRYMDEL
jgi:hypothetical protein